MKHSKLLDVVGIIGLFIGLSFALLPHALHTKAGFNEQSHDTHIVYGLIAAVISLIILIYNNDALKKFNKK